MLKSAYQNVSRDLLQPAASLPSLPPPSLGALLRMWILLGRAFERVCPDCWGTGISSVQHHSIHI